MHAAPTAAAAPLGAVSAAHVHVAGSAGPEPSAGHVTGARPAGPIPSAGPAPTAVPAAAATPKPSEGQVSGAGPAGPAGPAGAEPTGDIARSLLGATGCANNELPRPPANARWIASGDCNPQNEGSFDSTVCEGACLPGFTASGSFSSTCSFVGGTTCFGWTTTSTSLACKLPGCAGTPSTALGVTLPPNALWDCAQLSASPPGTTCNAGCPSNYVQAGNLSSLCAGGSGAAAWQAPTGSGITCTLEVPQAPCSNSPGPSTDGMPSNAQWACTGQITPSGSTCRATCVPGYGNVAPTVLLATCLNGVWRQPEGSLTCALSTAPCLQPPPAAWLPLGGKWDCSGTQHAAACTASCTSNYTKSGAITAWCYNGEYAQPTTNIACSPIGCSSNPGPNLNPNATWSCQLPAAHGVKCTAGCSGPSAAPDPPVAVCDFGNWVYSKGSCSGESSRSYFYTFTGPPAMIAELTKVIANGDPLTIVNNQIFGSLQNLLPLYSSYLGQLGFLLQNIWASQSTINTKRRQLLMDQGMDSIVIGMQVSLGLSDSIGTPMGASAGAGSCIVQLMPGTLANSSAGIISANHSSTESTVTVCGSVKTLFATFTYLASSIDTGSTKLVASIPSNSSTTNCSVTPDIVPGNDGNTSVAVTCQNADGSSFSGPETYTVLITANSTCSGLPLLTAAATNIRAVQSPTVIVRLASPPAPVCGGKPAVVMFIYTVDGLQPGQDLNLTTQVGPACTATLTPSPSKANGTAVVTCSGAFAPNASIPVELNITATTQGCGAATGLSHGNVSVLCCTTGSSYAKIGNSTSSINCFQHARPGATGDACAQAAKASGFINRGPGSGKLFLAQNTSSCTSAVAVGSIRVSCPDGAVAKKLLFKLTTPERYRSSERRYWVACAPPTSSAACPGKPTWIRVKRTTLEFNVTAGCSCSSAYYGLVDFASYRRLPPSVCGN
uniref:Sushi domain-containing protein n=1 Tax=Tetradesmus obliquus TaxID=3088 RepID=A0A383VY70_TETOB|eukprot:jgi/Sobl393_1/2186/SZX70415.1